MSKSITEIAEDADILRLVQGRNLLRIYDHAYYVKNVSLVPDVEYDKLFQDVKGLEEKYPEHNDPLSPTNRISRNRSDEFGQVQHLTPMLSIKTVLHDTYRPVETFLQTVAEKLTGHRKSIPPWKNVEVCGELKYDGLAVSLHYSQGRLTQAATRGDGEIGEDVTANAMTIKTIPLLLMEGLIPDEIEIRGEVMMSHEAFTSLNNRQRNIGEKLYSNPRNAAAGSLRQLDPSITAQRNLIFVPYSIGHMSGGKGTPRFTTQASVLNRFAKWGFVTTPDFTIVTDNEADLYRYYQHVLEKRSQLGFDIDGIVFKVNDLVCQKHLGITGREPNWAIAYKFPPEEASTVALNIRLQVGRIGTITPVLEVEPVRVGGVEVSNVNLHNQDEIDRHDVRIGDRVIIRRAGDVIPELVRVAVEQRTEDLKPYRIEEHLTGCPVCGSEVIKDGADYYCTGSMACPEQKARLIAHFGSRTAIKIEGLGDALAAELAQIIDTIDEIFTLDEETLKNHTTLGPKQIENLLAEISRPRELDAARVIYSFGIPNVGVSTARDLAKVCPDVISLGELNVKVKGVGPVTLKSIQDYFSKYQNVVNVVLRHITLKKSATGDKLKDLSFVITGSFDMKRPEIQELIIANGGTVKSSVSKLVNYVVAGESAGSNLKAARDLSIPVISLSELKTLLE